MRIAVTGSEGFVGKYLKAQLQITGQHEIIPLDLALGIDLSDETCLQQVPQFDVVIHLAGLSFVPDSFKLPALFYRKNYMMTLNVLELCRMYNSKIVYVSSYVYGNPVYLPIDEKHPLAAYNPYAQTKLMGEQLCQAYHRDFNVNGIVIRPFNIYGPGQNPSFLIASIICQMQKGQKIVLQDAKPRRDFVFVEDVADALVRAALNNEIGFDAFNVSSGESHSVEEIAQMLVTASRKDDYQIEYKTAERRSYDIMEVRGSFDKISSQLGWKPQTSLQDGLERSLQGSQ